jgi:DNA-binding NarL/FixJ family response regulator
VTEPLRVLIVDDHPVVRAGLRAILSGQTDMEVVAEAENGDTAVARALALRPDLVLMDLRLGAPDGLAATRRIKAVRPTTRVLVLTVSVEEADVVSAIEAGADGYLLKDAPPDRLLAAVRAVGNDESVLAPPALARLMAQVRRPARPSLSGREVEVLSLLAEGSGNKEIARALHLSEATIKSHLVRIYAKLGVDDRTAAVTTALGLGILRLDTPA